MTFKHYVFSFAVVSALPLFCCRSDQPRGAIDTVYTQKHGKTRRRGRSPSVSKDCGYRHAENRQPERPCRPTISQRIEWDGEPPTPAAGAEQGIAAGQYALALEDYQPGGQSEVTRGTTIICGRTSNSELPRSLPGWRLAIRPGRRTRSHG